MRCRMEEEVRGRGKRGVRGRGREKRREGEGRGGGEGEGKSIVTMLFSVLWSRDTDKKRKKKINYIQQTTDKL